MDRFFFTIGSIHIVIQASNWEVGEGGGVKLFVGAYLIINYRSHRHHGADTEHSVRSFPLCTVTQSMCALLAGIAAAAGCRILGLFVDGGTVNGSVGCCATAPVAELPAHDDGGTMTGP